MGLPAADLPARRGRARAALCGRRRLGRPARRDRRSLLRPGAARASDRRRGRLFRLRRLDRGQRAATSRRSRELWDDEDGWRSEPFAGTLANELSPYAFTEGCRCRSGCATWSCCRSSSSRTATTSSSGRSGTASRRTARTSSPRRRRLIPLDRAERVPLAERARIEACVLAAGEEELVQDGAGGHARAAVDDELRRRRAVPRAAASRPGRSGCARPGSGRRPGRSARPRRASAPVPGRRRASGAASPSRPSSSSRLRRVVRARPRDELRRLDLLRSRRAAARARRRALSTAASSWPKWRSSHQSRARPAGALVVADHERARADPGRRRPGGERLRRSAADGGRRRPSSRQVAPPDRRAPRRGCGRRGTPRAAGSRRSARPRRQPSVCMKCV